MTLQTGDIVLIRMQFHQAAGSKIRPALVLLDTGDDDFVAAPITSQARSAEFDFPFLDWFAAGLNVPSSVRLHKLTVLPNSDLVRKLGSCSASDRDVLHASFCKEFCPNESDRENRK